MSRTRQRPDPSQNVHQASLVRPTPRSPTQAARPSSRRECPPRLTVRRPSRRLLQRILEGLEEFELFLKRAKRPLDTSLQLIQEFLLKFALFGLTVLGLGWLLLAVT